MKHYIATQNNNALAEKKPLIADESTMTTYGITLGEIIADGAREVQVVKDQLAAAQRDIEAKAKQLEDAGNALDEMTKQKLILEELQRRDGGFSRLVKFPDGSIRLPVTLSVDCAGQLLEQANSAAEDPQQYIAKQVEDALLAVNNVVT